MAAWALLAALVACGLAGAALVNVVHLRRMLLGRSGRTGVHDDEELLRDAWLEEIEARGQEVLARIAAAEERLRAAAEPQEGSGVSFPREEQPDADRAVLGPDEVHRPASAPAGGTGERSEPRTPLRRVSGMAAQVRSLAAQGMDSAGIARLLGIGRGEVELILCLSEPDRG